MHASRSIFASIKSPQLWLFIGCFVLAFSAVIGRWLTTTTQQSQCLFPLAFYDIKSEREWVLTQGIYRSYRDGFSQGHLSYLGTLSRFEDGQLTAPITPIHRAVWFNGEFNHNLLKITVTQHSRGLGDKSRDEDVQKYVFPHLQAGDVSVIAMYLFNGRVLASGTESVARNVCIR
ncbi:hypothetical protein JK231_20475 [Pantoea sp. JGM49]|jgi:hypothetical protein|uniref:hypothetical protein n=1 Tax=unclassified Pantoea TaxID=2630326 RepID=UPI000BDB6C3E|nr:MULTISPECIES: hypothetical protein [unclassified Pantoea]MBS0882966.1 hypothetical protein [Pantoea sp. JGM49]MDI9279067.1 hypothetical protein [Pantoea sp. EABMAA-21]MXP54496.1 hypothetical protein [Pantoea sp. Seng]SNY67519.1 hypothetical protein SAMN02744778_02401 [Pantoea sp. GL120224-02]